MYLPWIWVPEADVVPDEEGDGKGEEKDEDWHQHQHQHQQGQDEDEAPKREVANIHGYPRYYPSKIIMAHCRDNSSWII